jgi:hypothetical protein
MMERLALHLALHGTIILIASLVAGLLLHKAIRLERPVSAWHLAHAGGSGRGVMLIALAAIIQLIAFSPSQLSAFVWLIIAFAWTSMAAMVIAAASGERGVTWKGSFTNRLVFALYVASAVTAFPAAVMLLVGLVSRLRAA